MNMYMCLSRLPVTANVVRQQDVVCKVHNPLVLMNERVCSVIGHQDDINQLCVVVILSHIFEALVDVEVHLIASISL